jgi:transmembrane sensor
MDQEKLYNLLAREIANELTSAEAENLQQLLVEHPDASYIREVFTRQWKEAAQGAFPHNMLEKHQQRLQAASCTVADEAVAAPHVRSLWLRIIAVAASIILIVFAGWKIQHRAFFTPLPLAQKVTPKGTRSQMLLPDGSRVWLNSGSRLEYPKTFVAGEPRVVQLEGEAFFQVTNDANSPFSVQTKSFTILVLGTSFNVRAYPEESSAVTSLVEGAVEVQLDKAGKQKVTLHPNEKLTVPANLFAIADEPVSKADTRKLQTTVYRQQLTQVRDSIVSETAWVNNKLAFKHLQLEKVTALLEQWYGTEIGFHNQQKRSLYFTGVFETDHLDDVLTALASTSSFSYTKDANGKIWIE